MIRRVCPICDQVMTGRHYCRVCHSWVRHPRIQDVTYYLNERHPQNETSCSYHDHDSYQDSVHRQGEYSASSKTKKGGKKDGKKDSKTNRKTKTEKTMTVSTVKTLSQTGKKNSQKSSKNGSSLSENSGNYRGRNDWEETFGTRTDNSKKEGKGSAIGAFSLFLILIVVWRLFLAIWSIVQAFLIW